MVLRVGVVSTYPPTRCGIASFTAALAASLERPSLNVRVVRIVGQDDTRGPNEPVVAELTTQDPASMAGALSTLTLCDVAVVQFEHGIYGGSDGSDAVTLLERLPIPAITILHTVLRAPSPSQRRVVRQIARNVEAVVVMSDIAARRLMSRYRVEPAKVIVIPHGASLAGRVYASAAFERPSEVSSRILTWGLIGPGKGIEWAIEALALLRHTVPSAVYTISGQTHPKVLARDGESYRNHLEAKAKHLGVADRVVLDPTYHDLDQLARLVRSAHVVLLPYDSPDQACSGVLIDAVACGVPVVATRFSHAEELLATGAGLTVDHQDAVSMASALEAILTAPVLSSSMRRSGLRLAESLTWDSVAERYHSLLVEVVRQAAPG